MKRMISFRNDGLTFDVRDSGPPDGSVIVLLHGFPQTSSSWNDVMGVLNERGFRTVAPDQRGYSPHARPRGRRAYRTSKLVGDVVALIEELGVGPVHLVGHDWGAAVAWSLAGSRPDLVRTLTTLSVPHPNAFLRSMLDSDQARRSYYMALFQLPFLPELLISRSGFLNSSLSGTGMTEQEIRRVQAEVVDSGALTSALNWYRGMIFGTPARGPVRVPTTHVWSDRDSALSQRGAELTEKWVDAPFRLELIEGKSHWLPEHCPVQIADIIVERVHSASS